MSLTIYIAGPMTGLLECNYPAFYAAERRLYNAGYMTENPARSDELHGGEPYSKSKDWYIRRAVEKLANSDGIALLPGWDNSEGVAIELQIAQLLDMDIRPIDDWIHDGV